jgi:hypothetical protein
MCPGHSVIQYQHNITNLKVTMLLDPLSSKLDGRQVLTDPSLPELVYKILDMLPATTIGIYRRSFGDSG